MSAVGSESALETENRRLRDEGARLRERIRNLEEMRAIRLSLGKRANPQSNPFQPLAEEMQIFLGFVVMALSLWRV